jgi:hypothetical protein
MKKIVLLLILASGTFTLVGSLANACGDKFLIVGRCVSYQRLHRAAHPGSLLLVWSASSRDGFSVRDPDLAKTLAEAGHQVAVLEDPGKLEEALTSGHFDLVLADIADADQLQQTIQAKSIRTMLVRIMSQATKAELTAAKQQHKHVLVTSSKRARIWAALDGAMAHRPKS